MQTHNPRANVAVTFTEPTKRGRADPLGPPIRTQAWKVRAMAHLIAAGLDAPSILRARGYQYRPNAAALFGAAASIATLAEKCRAARWRGDHPCRLAPDIYFEQRKEHDTEAALSEQSVTPLSMLIEAYDGAALERRDMSDPEVSKRAVDLLTNLNRLSYCYPTIPPSAEAAIAEHGYTAAEYLLDVSADAVKLVAAFYRTVEGARAAEFRRWARDATLWATAAKKTIEQGVTHTIAGGMVELPGAP